MRLFLGLQSFASLLVFCLWAATAQATHTENADAPLGSCGLPAAGAIHHAITYNLIGDCWQTDPLQLHSDIKSDPNGGGVTINGNGYVIVLSDLSDINAQGHPYSLPFAVCQPGVSLTLRNLWIQGGEAVKLAGCAVQMENASLISIEEALRRNPPAATPEPRIVLRTRYEPIPVGVYAKIFRWHLDEGDVLMRIWGIDPFTAAGTHVMLEARQSQVDALEGGGMLWTAPDCKAQIHVAADGDATVSVGPNAAGKLLHVEFDDGIRGAVVSTYDTDERTLCPPEADWRYRSLEYCVVVATDNVNLRDAPNGETTLNVLSAGRELKGLARMTDWIFVQLFSQFGWLSVDYLNLIGDCDGA